MTAFTPTGILDDGGHVVGEHLVLGTPYGGPWPDGHQAMVVAAGCFWGVEKLLWNAPGVWTTLPGYAGGATMRPSYREVCGARTGHTESVLAVFDPERTSFAQLLRLVLENHDPTQGDRQGNDIGPQYRSAVFPLNEEQARITADTLEAYAPRLARAGFGPITTEVTPLDQTPTGRFWVAEPFHRGYLEANPNGYCPVHATGVTCG
ncbi:MULTISPECIES: peptide-methionine (S)-S-oxide reductase MsrA [Corynebacterium]|uniref:peptide-methionine (S)-S-oxide reductase MsrA n=1 Tax=Corynebacterium TaxID=1716 RepID=UPI0008A50596|nr:MULTISPECIES: peptide-methionine (S)-S-oxide reductase MsrA [Corynebacterium]MCG7438877.1 peptide-methionine (S)-S-oxide reductase MsrA [Corynebacterium freneyi]OFU53858.1 peptide methionine sulfoxide reductase [Corynebacterium sp. HMSC11E11]